MKRPSSRPRPSAVQAEIRQSRPFRSVAQEATIALLRTASVVHRVLERIVEPHDLSLAQYNALRIIRGAGSGGIPTLDIRDRMVEEGTTITRLLDKLEHSGLIVRERGTPDRRQVICRATEAGRRLLDELDPIVNASDEMVVSSLTEPQLETLVRMLDRVRAANAERGAARAQAASGRVNGAAASRTRAKSRRT